MVLKLLRRVLLVVVVVRDEHRQALTGNDEPDMRGESDEAEAKAQLLPDERQDVGDAHGVHAAVVNQLPGEASGKGLVEIGVLELALVIDVREARVDGERLEIVEQQRDDSAQSLALLLNALAGHVGILLQEECAPVAIAVQPQFPARGDQLLHGLRVLRGICALLLLVWSVCAQHVCGAVDAG